MSRLITAICVCQLLDLSESMTNSPERPIATRKMTANVPASPKTVRLPVSMPRATPIRRTTAAWMSDLMTLWKILPMTIAPRLTGVLSALFMKPNLLSHTTDIPANVELNSTMKTSIPHTRYEK